MKILMVTMALGIGGAETHIVELARALSRMGHSVTVASAGGVFAEELAACGIEHVTLPLADKKPQSVVTAYRGLLKLIRDRDFDIVHGHARIPNFILSLVRKKVDFRFVTTAHLDFAVNALWRKITKWGERTLAVSDDIREYLNREYGTSRENVDITINGIDMEKFSPDVDFSDVMSEFGLDSDHRRAVYISRIDHDRSAPAFMLCECAPELARRYSDLDIVIVGAGDDFERLTAAAEEANARAGRRVVTLCGARSDINKFCAMADVFIAVSRSALEAMAVGVPVIVAGNQGYLGIFGEEKLETARLTNFCCRGCEMPSAEAILRDLSALLDSDERTRAKIGEYGRSVVREFYSADRMAKDYLDCYAKLPPSTDHRCSDVLFCGYYGYGNVGDELSLECTVEGLRRLRPDLRVTVLSSSPEAFSKRMGVRAVSRTSPLSIMREIRRTSLLVFGGGTLLQDKTSLRSLRYYAWILRAAARHRKKIYVYANGVGPLSKPRSRKMVKRALSAAEMITVRENSSADALCAAGIDRSRISLCADPAFLVNVPSDEDIASAKKLLGFDCGYFTVSLRDFEGRDERFMTEISDAIIGLAEKRGLHPLLISMQEEDRALCEKVFSSLEYEAYLVPPVDAKTLLALIAGGEFTLGMRLHSVILSACVNTPAVALSYDPKVDALCEYLGLPVPADVRNFTAAELVRAAKKGEGIADVASVASFREKARAQINRIVEMTEKN